MIYVRHVIFLQYTQYRKDICQMCVYIYISIYAYKTNVRCTCQKHVYSYIHIIYAYIMVYNVYMYIYICVYIYISSRCVYKSRLCEYIMYTSFDWIVLCYTAQILTMLHHYAISIMLCWSYGVCVCVCVEKSNTSYILYHKYDTTCISYSRSYIMIQITNKLSWTILYIHISYILCIIYIYMYINTIVEIIAIYMHIYIYTHYIHIMFLKKSCSFLDIK